MTRPDPQCRDFLSGGLDAQGGAALALLSDDLFTYQRWFSGLGMGAAGLLPFLPLG